MRRKKFRDSRPQLIHMGAFRIHIPMLLPDRHALASGICCHTDDARPPDLLHRQTDQLLQPHAHGVLLDLCHLCIGFRIGDINDIVHRIDDEDRAVCLAKRSQQMPQEFLMTVLEGVLALNDIEDHMCLFEVAVRDLLEAPKTALHFFALLPEESGCINHAAGHLRCMRLIDMNPVCRLINRDLHSIERLTRQPRDDARLAVGECTHQCD